MVQGTLNSTPNRTFNLDFYANATCDSTGFGEGQSYLGSVNVTTDASGNASFTFTTSTTVASDQFITSTATDPNGNTSEFSACLGVRDIGPLHLRWLPPTSTGSTVQFNQPIAPSVLNLIDTEADPFAPADVTLVGAATGPVAGSLVVDPSGSRVT